MYGVVGPTGGDPFPTHGGVALLSYTWEDDAQKFSGYEHRELALMLVERLEEYLRRAGLPGFRRFMLDPGLEAAGAFTVFQWSAQPSYHGAAKAYQAGIENMNYSLLTYNATFAKRSNLYFAGDGYSLESGWMEPALRMALDATLHLLHNDPNAALNDPGCCGFHFATNYAPLATGPLGAAAAQRTRRLGKQTLSQVHGEERTPATRDTPVGCCAIS